MLAASIALCGCDFVEVRGMRADRVLPIVRDIARNRPDLLALMAGVQTGDALPTAGAAEAIRAVRAFDGGVELVVDLLEHGDETVAGSAAGATQNLSRERASRARAREILALPLFLAGVFFRRFRRSSYHNPSP